MVDRNPASRWDEGTEIQGLTSYDINRTIRKISSKEETIAVPEDVINSLFSEDLKCRVCLGVLESTLTTTCLHRFCSECLHRSLRMELGPKMHHECPSCRAKLASRRASKADSKFDRLVQIFSGVKRSADEMNEPSTGLRGSSEGRSSPRGSASSASSNATIDAAVDLKKFRDMHKENVGKFREMRAAKLANGTGGGKNTSQSASSSSRKAMNAAYAGYEKTEKGGKKNASASNKAGSSAKAAAAEAAMQNKVWLKLFPTPEWSPEASLQQVRYDSSALKTGDKGKMELSHPYLRVPPYKTILSLKAYLLQKFSFPRDSVTVDIYGSFKNKMTMLDDALSVLDMTTKHWNARSELVLYFKLKAK